MIVEVVKVLLPSIVAFAIGVFMTPVLTNFLYKHKMWKKKSGKHSGLGGGGTPIFNRIHKEKDTGTPRMGGVVIWGSVTLTAIFFWLVSVFVPGDLADRLNFISRSQTWLPFFTLIVASLLGLIDDYLVVSGKGGYIAGGLPLKLRIALVSVIGLIGGWWFYFKLAQSSVWLPFVGTLDLGLFFIPLFVLVMVALFSGGVIDGIDGLAGGLMSTIFASYGVIAFFQNQFDLAALCAALAGGILAFLWFNIPPARFYMTETGILGLTTTLAVVAFLTGHVFVLPIIAFPLFLASASVIIQVLSKKMRHGKKVFLVAPIHHHFEALGWPSYKVTMRFWIVGLVFAVFGLIIVFVG
jgi:phospho-N-acetylmuramoyl-pentapeptide-transferase